MQRVWHMNLTADLELESPRKTLSASTLRTAERFAPRAASLLVPRGDRVWDGRSELHDASELEGRAFCPTPRVLARFAAADVCTRPAPSLDVLRATNDRAFCAALGRTLPRAHGLTCRSELRLGPGEWLLKRAFGFAGRGQRAVRAPLTESDERWLAASLRLGGVEVEPCVELLREVGSPGYIEGERVRVGDPVEQFCVAGVWRESRRLEPGDLADDVAASLRGAAREVGHALRERGYFGPFGVDAYLYRLRSLDTPRWNLRSEINARYSMGWALGWSTRPDL
ncbi:MAG: hypothetical protein GXP55_02825 [Deltaproteobacteria bacterium]|nr:hypothetical protein [Deltaproteobacteria bacterium]